MKLELCNSYFNPVVRLSMSKKDGVKALANCMIYEIFMMLLY